MRLRKYLGRSYRYYFQSEYGLEDFRPHYHGILMNFDYTDRHDFDSLYKAWSLKGDEIGFFDVDFATSSNIRYTMKYLEKEFSADVQSEIEKRKLTPLFHRMSKGIGRDYFYEHLNELRTFGGYFVKGKLRPLPRYYSDLLELVDRKSISLSEFENKFSKYYELCKLKSIDWNIFRPPPTDLKDVFVDTTKLREYAQLKLLRG